MFYKYEVNNNGKEEILYLYLKLSEEFSSELTIHSDENDLARRTKNFIKNKNITFNGHKVYLIINDIIVKVIDINDKLQFDKYSDDFFSFNIKFDESSKIEIKLKDFLLGCLASIYNNSIDLETLKSFAIIFRSYVFYNIKNYKFVLAYSDFINYKPISYYKFIWKDDYINIYKKLVKAVDYTTNIFLSFNNNFIIPFWHVSNPGKTFTNKSIKYLVSVESPWDIAAKTYVNIKDFDFSELGRIFDIDFFLNKEIKVVNEAFNDSNKYVLISNKKFDYNQFLKKLNLKTNDFIAIIYNKFVRFITIGSGSYLGLSLFGANELAKNDFNYLQIIKYYYPLLTINRFICK